MKDRASRVSPEFPVRLGRRLSLGLALIVITMLAAGGGALFLGLRIHDINKQVDQGFSHALATGEIYDALHQIISEVQHIQATGMFDRFDRLPSLRRVLSERARSFVDDHRKEEPTPLETIEEPFLQSLGQIEADLGILLDHVEKNFGSRVYLQPEQMVRLRDVLDRGLENSKQLHSFHQGRVLDLSQQGQRLIRLIIWLYLLFLVMGAFLVGAASVVFHRMIGAPLVRLAGTALRIAEGRLEERVPVRSRDEIGQLSNAFNVMVERLQEREGELRSAQTRLETKVRETQALYQIGNEISSLQRLDSILESVVGNALKLLGGEAAVICLLTPARDELVVRATSGSPEFFLKNSGDVQPVTAKGLCAEDHPVCCSVMRAEQVGSHLSVPLQRGDRAIGVICISSREARRFGAAEHELLAGLATQAAIAIDNARLHEEVREYAANEERRRIARDIHDGVAQSVSLLHLKIQQAQGLISPERSAPLADLLREAATISAEAYEEVRRSILGLRTMVSRSLGLVPALTEFLHEFSVQSGIRADLEVGEGAEIHLPPTAEVQVIRIVQEALTNVRKHAQAGRAWVRLQRQDGVVRVIIEDDGRGWEPKAVFAADPTHVGLEIMRERAENLRGTLEIATAPGRGTRVTATVPLERTA